MKVFIPVVDSSSHRYEIAGGFSESGSVCIYDSSDNHATWYESTGVGSGYDDVLNELKTSGVINVITSSILPMALKVFSNSGFTVYKSVGSDLLLNLELLRLRCLPLFGYEDALSEIKGCGSACESCETSVCKN